jgi:dATP pyrophosphohydrolase
MSDTGSCVAISVYVLRRQAGEIEMLFLRRSGGRFEGQWWPVTGTRESSEDPIQCALRELQEETGLTPSALYQTDLTAPVEGGGYLRIFVAPVDSAAVVCMNWEHDAYRWCSSAAAHAIVGGFAEPILSEAVRVFEAGPPAQKVFDRC